MSVTICIKSTNNTYQGSRGYWSLDTCKESWTKLTEDVIETWDVRYIYFLIFFALPALINSIQKAPTTLPPRQMKLVTFRGSIVIEFIDCRLFIDFPVESAETWWKRENVLPHVSMPHCTWPPYSPDRAPFLLPSWTSATSSRPVLVSHCHSAIFPPDNTIPRPFFLSQLVINKQGLEKRKPMTRTQM